ncbi:hypothetical protein HK102_014168 [Quaeritorhiza haematococci]|nr:hypothetical protein HK102_014168 [Quaeritorhiza haematococci]
MRIAERPKLEKPVTPTATTNDKSDAMTEPNSSAATTKLSTDLPYNVENEQRQRRGQHYITTALSLRKPGAPEAPSNPKYDEQGSMSKVSSTTPLKNSIIDGGLVTSAPSQFDKNNSKHAPKKSSVSTMYPPASTSLGTSESGVRFKVQE